MRQETPGWAKEDGFDSEDKGNHWGVFNQTGTQVCNFLKITLVSV